MNDKIYNYFFTFLVLRAISLSGTPKESHMGNYVSLSSFIFKTEANPDDPNSVSFLEYQQQLNLCVINEAISVSLITNVKICTKKVNHFSKLLN